MSPLDHQDDNQPAAPDISFTQFLLGCAFAVWLAMLLHFGVSPIFEWIGLAVSK